MLPVSVAVVLADLIQQDLIVSLAADTSLSYSQAVLKVGICGEPGSIEFRHIAGLNCVSCSPFRVPVARLAVAHAALKYRK